MFVLPINPNPRRPASNKTVKGCQRYNALTNRILPSQCFCLATTIPRDLEDRLILGILEGDITRRTGSLKDEERGKK
jgi:hypothetical protein